jgi:uncharacterized phage-associated protein
VRRSDWTLLAIAEAGGEALTPVQLQKVLFLLGAQKPQDVRQPFFEFRPYNYGPFSADVYRDADALEQKGLVRIDRSEPGRSWSVFAASPEGLIRATDLKAGLPSDLATYVERLVAWSRSLTFQQLVSAVYSAYPEQRANSIFVG